MAADTEEKVTGQENAEAETEETKDAESSCTEEAAGADEETKTSEEKQEEAPKAEEAKSADAGKEKKGFFKKKDKKDKKDEQIEELTDKLKRQMAEFENFRKRTEKEKAAMYEIGAKSAIEKFLPVVDSFERGLATLDEEEAHTPFAEGMDKIYKQLLTTLETLEVKPMNAKGQEFNPEYHNAVMHVDDETLGENVVAEEFQKGYFYRDSVLRHSMVKVAN